MAAKRAAGPRVPDILVVREDRSDGAPRTGRGRPSPCDVISVYLEGGPKYRLADRTYTFEPPVGILIAEGTLDDDLQEGRVNGIFALFRGRGLLKPGPGAGNEVRVSLGGGRLAVPCLKELSPADARKIVSTLDEVKAVREAGQIGKMRKIALLFRAISDYCEADARSRAGGIHREAARLRRLIEERAFEDVPLREIYREVDLSQPHAETLFKAGYGTTPVAYRTQLRLARARALLVSSRLNVSQVAYAVGYSDPLYFSRVFRGAFGTAPSTLIREFDRLRR